ncbi:DUF2796 domain-containing protein [Pseudomonas asuensis]|uniref:DUF2796 domain-containing protein n=1 Tax=Pseudomonas asuensis TaxID=1825787 RepID=A0ABQ2GJU7_9PSED|nr:DUF2796 domain-containing protein [Pseudomonas asuensis]GGL99043.1 hypothetical protein GCM10009425_07730 [Pseudomonas asuensis]
MRSLLLALPFAVLPLTVAYAHDEHDHAHGSLGAHEHGVAQLNVALDNNSLELELHSPAMNLVGFEHKAQSDQDKKAVEMAKQQLANPITLFGIPAAAGCKVSKTDLDSPLFGGAEEHHDHGHDNQAHGSHAKSEHDHEHAHSDIDADYTLTCENPKALTALDLAGLFKQFPATHKVNVQAITAQGQKGEELTPTQTRLAL